MKWGIAAHMTRFFLMSHRLHMRFSVTSWSMKNFEQSQVREHICFFFSITVNRLFRYLKCSSGECTDRSGSPRKHNIWKCYWDIWLSSSSKVWFRERRGHLTDSTLSPGAKGGEIGRCWYGVESRTGAFLALWFAGSWKRLWECWYLTRP